MNWKVSLPMYNVSPRLRQTYAALLEVLLEGAEVDADLMEPESLIDFWRRPDMLLSQTCGYPYVTRLRGHVTLIATPAFDFPGCDGSDYSSMIVARKGGGIDKLADARGRTAAINDAHSNSGMNVLRHAVASLADNGRFFREVLRSGSHAGSLEMVSGGEADIAAIDCVTYGYTALEYPERLRDISVLGRSVSAPGLPWIAGSEVPPGLIERLRSCLLHPGPRLRELMLQLRIKEFTHLDDAAYDRIDRIAEVWQTG